MKLNVLDTDSCAAEAPRPVRFEVKSRLKLWVVMRDDVYCGSYAEESVAQEAAQKHVNAVIRGGGKAFLVHP